MRILYVSQYFPPEMGAPSARVHELSRAWVRLGHQVTVLTGFAHHPTGRKARGDRGRITRTETLDGIDVIRTYVLAVPNRGIFLRMLSYLSFMLSALVLGRFRVEPPDVVIATSPQLLCGLAGRLLAKRFHVPFVFEVRDLWPESLLAVEAMKENAVVRGLRRLAEHLYRTSAAIVTVGEGYKRQILQRYALPAEKIRVIENGIDPNLFLPGPRMNATRQEYGWDDRFVVLYLGTHGMAHALHAVVGAASLLQEDKQIRFVFVGEGAEKKALKQLVHELRLDNVEFIDAQPKSRVPGFYAACDLGLVTLRNTALFQDVLPSKMFEYLAMERPILLAVGGEARSLVEKAEAGEYVEPENATELARAIRKYADAPEQLTPMGKRGRAYVLEHHDRHALAEQYADLLEEVVEAWRRALL